MVQKLPQWAAQPHSHPQPWMKRVKDCTVNYRVSCHVDPWRNERRLRESLEFQDSLNVLLLIKMSLRILNTKPGLFRKCMPVLALRLVNTMGKQR